MIIKENLLNINKMSRRGYQNKGIKNIVIHYVGNPNTTAIANRNYFDNLKNQTSIYASTHYIVGLQGEIIRCIPESEVAYHSGNLDVNYRSLGIETCHPDPTGEWNNETYNSLIELCTELCKRYNLDPIQNVIRHYDVTGKRCPLYYVNNESEWNNFKQSVLSSLNSNQTSYTVIKGDNLTKIANEFGTSVDELARLNNIANKNKISVGQVIKIPGRNITTNTYKVIPVIGLNCRLAPSINSQRIKGYTQGTVLTISEIQNGWGRTPEGWVSMNFIEKI